MGPHSSGEERPLSTFALRLLLRLLLPSPKLRRLCVSTTPETSRRQLEVAIARDGSDIEAEGCVPDLIKIYKTNVSPHGPFASTVRLDVRDGDVIMFPAWLMHSVPAKWSEGAVDGDERVVFSFNICG